MYAGVYLSKSDKEQAPCFLSYNLPNLGRLIFGGPREKTPRPHQFSLPSPLPTKQPLQQFSLHFSLQPNIPLSFHVYPPL